MKDKNFEDKKERAHQVVEFLNGFFEEHGRLPSSKEVEAAIPIKTEESELTYEIDEWQSP